MRLALAIKELTVNAGKESPECSVVTAKDAPGRVGPGRQNSWPRLGGLRGSLEDITPVASRVTKSELSDEGERAEGRNSLELAEKYTLIRCQHLCL